MILVFSAFCPWVLTLNPDFTATQQSMSDDDPWMGPSAEMHLRVPISTQIFPLCWRICSSGRFSGDVTVPLGLLWAPLLYLPQQKRTYHLTLIQNPLSPHVKVVSNEIESTSLVGPVSIIDQQAPALPRIGIEILAWGPDLSVCSYLCDCISAVMSKRFIRPYLTLRSD